MIVEAVAYIVHDKSFSVIHHVPRILRFVSHWLHKLLVF